MAQGTILRYALVHAPQIHQLDASETWGPTGRVGIVPLDGDRCYFFACLNAAPNNPAMTVEGLRAHFAGFHAPIPELLALKRTSDPVEAFRMYEQRRLARTHFIVNTSRRLGAVAQVEIPWLAALRNWLFRRIPDSLNERQLCRVLTVKFDF